MPRPLSLSSGWLRVLIWIAVAGLVSVFVLSSTRGTVLASTSLHQTPPISWDDEGFQGSEDECEDADVGSGEVLWHFVLVQTSDTSATLDALFQNAGPVSVGSYKKSGNVLHFEIITGEDTLLGASTDGDGRWLNLSHICAGPPETTTTTTTTSTSTTTSTTTTTETQTSSTTN